jgi:hypothetical protein
MQHEITVRKPLLRANGTLAEAGYAKKPILIYERDAIKASALRIKEWDYYLINNSKIAVALTIADNGYMGLDSISLIDFERPWQATKSPIRLFPMGNTKMPESTESGDTESYCKNHYISFKREKDRRSLEFRMADFYDHKTIEGKISIEDPAGESMVIATPFSENPLAFYYNQKINCMPAKGYVRLGDTAYHFHPDDAMAVLDWGRGVWTYKNTWYWGSASGYADGLPFGFNSGYGFGDTSAATENMIFVNHKAHKISQVVFTIPTKNGNPDYLAPWFFTSDDDRFKMIFNPIVDRNSRTNLGFLCSDQHQVFGRFTGRVVLDDGSSLNVKDLLGFAEKVYNKW